MGSGKSTIGRGLAGSFNCRFIDLDHYMEDKWAMSVSAIVEEYRYLSSKEPYTLVLALGGGTVTYPQSARIIKEETSCVYLQCPKEILLERLIKNNSRRPLLAGKSEEEMSVTIDNLMAAREAIYINCAEWVYDMRGKRMGIQMREFAQRFGL